MPSRRRIGLLAGAVVTGVSLLVHQESTGCDEIACFSFEYHGADDAPDRLDIQHTGGQEDLKAGDVYFSDVVVDWESRETDTLAWSELDDEMELGDTIDGDEIQLQIMTEIVKIVWRHAGDEQVIEAWVYDDDAS